MTGERSAKRRERTSKVDKGGDREKNFSQFRTVEIGTDEECSRSPVEKEGEEESTPSPRQGREGENQPLILIIYRGCSVKSKNEFLLRGGGAPLTFGGTVGEPVSGESAPGRDEEGREERSPQTKRFGEQIDISR